MRIGDYKVQSLLTMDEFPNYPSNNSVIKNRAYFTITDTDVNEILNKGINHITVYNRIPSLKDNSFLVAVNLDKIDTTTHLIRNTVNGKNIDFITPQAIIFVDFFFVINTDKKFRISLSEIVSHINQLANDDKGLTKFLRGLKKEEDNFVYIDFYELLDILVIYGIIDRKICDNFI